MTPPVVGSALYRKELRSLARLRKAYFARALVAGGVLAAMIASVNAVQDRAYFPSQFPGSNANALVALGWQLAFVLFLGCHAAIFFIVPLLTAPIVAGEVERKTLGLLVISKLSYGRILASKLAARLHYLLLLLASLVPLIFAFVALGGLMPSFFLWGALSLATSLVWVVAAGMLCTCLMRTTATALVATWVLAILFRLPFMLWALGQTRLIRYIFGSLGDGAIILFAGHDVVSAPFCGVLGVVVLGLAWWGAIRLLPQALRDDRSDPLKRLVGWIIRVLRRPGLLGRALVHDNVAIGSHPMLWRELHKRFYSSNGFAVRLFCLVLVPFATAVVAGALLGEAEMGAELVTLVLVPYIVTPVIFLAAVFSASAVFSGEHRLGSWDVLLTTPVATRTILLSKWMALHKPVMALLVPAMLGLGLIDARHSDAPLGGLATVVSLLPAIFAIGITCSLCCRSLVKAFAATLVIVLLLEWGLTIAIGLSYGMELSRVFEPGMLGEVLLYPFASELRDIGPLFSMNLFLGAGLFLLQLVFIDILTRRP